MLFRSLADVVLVTHLTFVLFVIFGGLLVLRWPNVAWVHLPVALYGVLIEYIGFICPLTPLEIWLRQHGGEQGYTGGFVAHYVTAMLYPTGLTRTLQIVLGSLVLVINGGVYLYVLTHRTRRAH
jgi:hypothetical protein